MEMFKFSKKQLVAIVILCFFLLPVFPFVIGLFVAYKFLKKRRIIHAIVAIFIAILLAGLTVTIYSAVFKGSSKSNTEQVNTNVQPTPMSEPKEDFIIKNTTVRSGSGIHGVIFSTDLNSYKSELENMEDITASVSGNVIPVDGRRKIEMILEYEPLEVKSAGIFGGGSEFYIIEEDGSTTRPTDAGSQRSFKIENDKAGVTFAPFVHINDDFKGGKAKLVFVLETKQGKKYTKEWILDVSPYIITQ